jgi:hypothetical protein
MKTKKLDVRDILNDKNSVIICINKQQIKLKEEEFIEMALIHNAIQNGFTVKKNLDSTLEFKKGATRELRNKNFTKRFIQKNMDITTLLQKK